MSIMGRRAWTNDELVKVMALYCQIPFGKMHARNPAVIALALVIDRTPSAVALKLVNFASLDPELRERGVGGMPNVSQLDRQVWDEFYGRWEALADATVIEVVETVERKPREPVGLTEVRRESTVRRGQSFFRAAVMAAHNWRCCVTGISALELLRASHIVPWAANAELRLNPRNGLCLNALHDAAFDSGLITFSSTFEMQLSSRLRDEVPAPVYQEMFEKRCENSIVIPERFSPAPEMLEYHRTKVFCA